MSSNKIYYLSTCDTCTRIIKETGITEKHFQFQDIKTQSITETQLDELKAQSGSYEALFSKIARKFRAMELHTKTLSESDYKKLILTEYTFLKRPVVMVDDKIFIGNAKSTIAALKQAIKG
jgi:arsenate reductase (glutaredoxin)